MNIRLWPETTTQLKERAEKQVQLYTTHAARSRIPVIQARYEADAAFWAMIVAACDEALQHETERVA